MDSPSIISPISDWLNSGSINIFGIPFAGKDTQGRRLAKLLDAPLLGGGEILRQSHMPEHIKELHKSGKLFPTDIYLELVLPYLGRKEFEGRPLILSSVGRWHGEEAGVLEATAASGHPIKAVIFLNLDEDEVWKRWQAAGKIKDRGAREDDSYETIQTRLDEFRNKTIPVIDFYREQNLLIELDGSGEPDEVMQSILQSLLNFSKDNQPRKESSL